MIGIIFDCDGVLTDQEGTNKPKPYIYLHAAQLLDLNPYNVSD